MLLLLRDKCIHLGTFLLLLILIFTIYNGHKEGRDESLTLTYPKIKRESLHSVMVEAGSKKEIWHGFARYYEPFLGMLRDQPLRLVEIGVEDGRSIEAWLRYFTRADHIFGIGYGTKNEWQNIGVTDCSKYSKIKSDRTDISQHMNCSLFKGDQSDQEFLEFFKQKTGGNFNIVIDDASHVPSHQLTSFESLWPTVVPGGIYVVEDVETSYWKQSETVYGNKLAEEKSFVEHMKLVADVLNRKYAKGNSPFSSLYNDISSIHFGQNIIIIQKQSDGEKSWFEGGYGLAAKSGVKGLPYP